MIPLHYMRPSNKRSKINQTQNSFECRSVRRSQDMLVITLSLPAVILHLMLTMKSSTIASLEFNKTPRPGIEPGSSA